jgi:hypothetical protein
MVKSPSAPHFGLDGRGATGAKETAQPYFVEHPCVVDVSRCAHVSVPLRAAAPT